METAIEVLKDYYDKDNIFQSVKMAMEEYSSLQNRSLVEEKRLLVNACNNLARELRNLDQIVQFSPELEKALSYKEETKNG